MGMQCTAGIQAPHDHEQDVVVVCMGAQRLGTCHQQHTVRAVNCTARRGDTLSPLYIDTVCCATRADARCKAARQAPLVPIMATTWLEAARLLRSLCEKLTI